MASKAQMTGMRGVYLVAAELSRRGFVVSPTSRNAAGADLLVTDQRCRRAFSVQVKTNARTFNFWLIGKPARDAVSRSHVYVLVNIKDSRTKGHQVEYFVVPSARLASLASFKSDWPHVRRDKVESFKDAWSVFGAPA